MDDHEDRRMAAISRLLFIGPVVILLAWFLAGQWDLAGIEARSWLQFIGVVFLAALTPLPGVSWSLSGFRSRVQWWGWVAVAGVVVTS